MCLFHNLFCIFLFMFDNYLILKYHYHPLFFQQSKIHGNRLQYYPTPIKQIAPNLQERPPEYQVSERSENVLRNLERDQWLTTHNLNYTGLGPANPMCLDNLECKNVSFFKTGLWDDNLVSAFYSINFLIIDVAFSLLEPM